MAISQLDLHMLGNWYILVYAAQVCHFCNKVLDLLKKQVTLSLAGWPVSGKSGPHRASLLPKGKIAQYNAAI